MSNNNPPTIQPIFTAKAATGVGTPFAVGYYPNIQIMLATESSASFTMKIQGSYATTAPNFASPATVANPWFFVASWDLDSNTLTAGSTGYVATGTDLFKGILVNVDGLQWLNCDITAYSAGAITATGYANND